MTNLARHYGVREMSYWSPILGCDVVRVSMANERGEEYYAVLPRLEGAAWRDRKREACEVLHQAIEDELRPGEIRWK